MKSLPLSLLPFVLLLQLQAAEPPSTTMTVPGPLLTAENFEVDPLGKSWLHHYSASTVKDGVLIAAQEEGASHGAVLETLVNFKDAIIQFSFKLEGTTRFNVPIDDKQYKESHAGHICRLSITPQSIFLGDDKEGVMRNDIFAMRRGTDEEKAAANKLLKGRSTTVPTPIQPGTWYTVTMEILGDEMLVSLDGKPLGYLQSPGIAHDTKTDFGFTVNGQFTHFDNVSVWAASAAPDWADKRDEVVRSLGMN